jgi:hypothetical protein
VSAFFGVKFCIVGKKKTFNFLSQNHQVFKKIPKNIKISRLEYTVQVGSQKYNRIILFPLLFIDSQI